MNLSLSDPVFERAAHDPDRTAIDAIDERITFGMLAAEAAGLATLLREEGFGDATLTILLPNLPRFASVLHGILAAGGTVAMCNPVNSPREVAEQLHDAAAVGVVTTEELRPLVAPGIPILLIDRMPDGITLIRNDEERWLPLPLETAPPARLRGGEAPAVILFTAAEQGRARGAVLTHRNLLANLRSTVAMMSLTSEDRMLAALPLVHAFGLTVGLNSALAVGAPVVPIERFHPQRTLTRMVEAGVTVFAGVPAMFMGILSVADRLPVADHPLRLALSGGAPLRPEVQAAWEARFGIPLRQGYGLTEASPVCLFDPPGRTSRPGTMGIPLPNVEAAIHDGSNRPLPPGEVGELCVRGENVFAGYLNGAGDDPVCEGWLRTGDLAFRDHDGYFRFVGLLKPMFTRSAFNVYPREIERVLTEDPRIARALVTALPDAARENEIVLEVEAATGHRLDVQAVKDICRARLAAYKQPGRIAIL